MELYRLMPDICSRAYSLGDLLLSIIAPAHIPKMLIFFVALFALDFLISRSPARFSNSLYRYRYLVAAALFALTVLLNVSGSSIGLWAESFLVSPENSGIIASVARECRTDEYALFTAMTFAQLQDPSGFLPYFGSVLRGTTTDMFLLYGQPVLDPAFVFRPFQWGYLFLGLSRGLSFYWFGRLIALFMASFEFGMLLLRKNRQLVLAYAALVTFAPTVAWWFSINGLVEMLVFGQAGIVLLRQYTQTARLWIRILIAALLVIFVGGFALAVYPAWEIPLAYVFVAIALTAGASHFRELHFGRQDTIIAFIAIAVLAASMAYIFLKSHDLIVAELNTAYPGKRIEAGGGAGNLVFHYVLSYLLPFMPSGDDSGLAEGRPDSCAMFFSLFPLGIILAVINIARCLKCNAKPDAITICLLILTAAFGFTASSAYQRRSPKSHCYPKQRPLAS